MADFQKDNNKPAVRYDPILFHNDEQIYTIYKKIEAIIGALFLVTNLTPDSEMLKGELRRQSLLCLTKMVELISSQRIDVVELQKLASLVTHMNSLIDIAFWSGIVSQMNASLLQREIGFVYKTVNDLVAKYKNNFYVDSDFFKVPDTTGTYKGQDKKHNIKDMNLSVSSQDRFRHGMQASVKKSETGLDESKQARRQAILDLLKQKSNLSVKDFAGVIPGYSEKTIQRELLALVEEGIVKKEGERRWSTYTIAQ